MKRRLLISSLRFAVALVLFGLCLEVASVAVGLPSLAKVISGLRELWTTGVLPHDVEVTSARWLIGWSSGALVGTALGLLTGRSRAASILLEGLFVLLRAIPFIALLPLTLRIFGLTESGKFFLIGWATAGVCWVVVHQTARTLPASLRWRSLTLGASPSHRVFRVLLPTCSSGIYSALRTSLALALIVVAIAEMGGVYQRSTGLWWSEGLGYRLFRSYDIARDDQLLGAILVFAVLGILLEQCFLALWSLGAYLSFKVQQRKARRAVARFDTAGVEFGSLRPATPAEVKLENITAAYDGRAVISELSLEIAPGATLCIIGPSGCGKTTLLRAIGHLVDDELVVTGDVKVAGEVRRSPGVWMGVVFQDSLVFDYMTVWDNVTFGNGASEHAAWQLLFEFGLAPFAAVRAATLSGGQRQRLAVATAVANQPKLLLLDEPFGALDAITRRQLQTFYRDHVRGRVTSAFVTHDLTEALLVSDTVAIGVNIDRKTLEVDRAESLSPDWEFTPRFAELKRMALVELERISTVPMGSEQEASHKK